MLKITVSGMLQGKLPVVPLMRPYDVLEDIRELFLHPMGLPCRISISNHLQQQEQQIVKLSIRNCQISGTTIRTSSSH